MKTKTIKQQIDQLFNKPTTLYQKFHAQTKTKKLNTTPDDPTMWPKTWSTVFYKDYPRLDQIILPQPTHLPNISLQEVLKKRSSRRDFSKEPLQLEQISNLLYFSSGIKNIHTNQQSEKRFYPSAGGRYPLEVYLISQNTDLANGLYHYNLRSHALETLLLFETYDYKKYFSQAWIKKAGGIILFTSIFYRNTMKYGDRGYRHILSETGILAQNFHLNATALDIKCCGNGGYHDDALHELLDIDGINESVVFTLIIGS